MPTLDDPLLALAADVLDDLETVWIANTNRLRQLTRDEDDADGENRGFGLDASHPDVARLAALVEGLDVAQRDATRNLERMMRHHPLGLWVKAQRGLGDKQAARLLAAVGDPYWHAVEQRPRTVSELWAYSGYRPGQRRRKGERANWSADAKMRAYLIAESCKRQLVRPCALPDGQAWAVHLDDCACSPYRVLYDRERERLVDTAHPEPCVRCGPAGSPAAAGTARAAGHVQAMALRRVAKEVLADLWREAKRLHARP